MPTNIPLSLRITSDDAAFLAELEVPGARTPSEKVRAILANARRQHRGTKDLVQCLELIQDMMRPSLNKVRAVQADLGLRSDFVLKLYEKVPELLAELVAVKIEAGDVGEESQVKRLRSLEADLANEVFGLIEEIVNMGLTSKSRTYDPRLIKDRMEPIIEIVELQKMIKQREISDER
ncbi:MAG: hypothetical protein MI923_16990 [Phycisphaerales bacterium]|nr:hypothetical protein [Phycisphaerales bacterium]